MSLPLTARQVFARFLKVPAPGTRRLVPVRLYPAQERLIDAFDAVDAAGEPQYPEVAFLAIKKAGKSTLAAGLALAELVGNTREPDREVLLIASDLAQSVDVVFAAARRFVARDAFLRARVRVLRTELVYSETITDARTGGQHSEDHVLRALPGRDARSLHGSNATLTVLDELWTHGTYDVIEAVARSPTRRCPRLLYTTYAGLVTDKHEGHPLWDLWQRWQAGDPALFVSYIGGPDGWRAVPWLTEKFLDQQRRQFAAVPSKFRRLWLNEWADDDTSDRFVTAEELAAAVDPTLTEPARGDPGLRYAIGVDLGVTHDWSAVVVAHVEPGTGRVVVDALRSWRGTRARPVPLPDVEAAVVGLAARFPLRAIRLDQWQGRLMADSLARRGLPAAVVTTESAWLDRAATTLRGLFSGRQVRLPRHEDLITQLEHLRAEELRRDRVRYTSGSGTGAGAHDDLIVAFSLAIDGLGRDVGQRRLPAAFTSCIVADYFASQRLYRHGINCYLLGGLAIPSDPVCRHCVGHRAVMDAWQTWGQAAGLDLRGVRAQFGENDFTSRRWQDRWAAINL